MTALLLEPRVAGVAEIEDVPVELFEDQTSLSLHRITACKRTCTYGMTYICDS